MCAVISAGIDQRSLRTTRFVSSAACARTAEVKEITLDRDKQITARAAEKRKMGGRAAGLQDAGLRIQLLINDFGDPQ